MIPQRFAEDRVFTLDEYLSENGKRFPGKTFLLQGKDRICFEDLDRYCDALATFLMHTGVQPADRVAVFLENSPEYVVSFIGTLRAGAVAVPLSDRHTLHSAGKILRDFAPSTVILRYAMFLALRSLFHEMPGLRSVIIADRCAGSPDRNTDAPSISVGCSPATPRVGLLSEILLRAPAYRDFPVKTLSDNAMIIYTSGTTGPPKGVVLSHRNIVFNAFSIIEYLRLSDSDSVMVVLPFHYSYGNSLLTTHLICGGTLVLENRFLYPNVVLEKMVEHGVTGFAGVPSTYSLLLRRSNLRALRFPHLRYVTQAGGAMSPDDAQCLGDALPGTEVYIMYGQTEATARLTWLDPVDLQRKAGSIGKAIPGVTIRLVREDGKEAGPGETGEIVARGKNIMYGYWNRPEETAKVLRADGLHTGDLARMDEEGYLFLLGRRNDLIKSGAHRIGPGEIEEVLLGMRGVEEAAAVGVPDDILGESVCAVVVPRVGWTVTGNEVIVHCRERLPSYKIPKKVVFMDTLPKTCSGKIRRRELAESIAGVRG